jgi:hypothetical protein
MQTNLGRFLAVTSALVTSVLITPGTYKILALGSKSQNAANSLGERFGKFSQSCCFLIIFRLLSPHEQ